MSGNKYADKNGKANAAGIKRLKRYAKETEEHLRQIGKYDGDRFYMSRMKLLEGGFDELNLSDRTLYVPNYVMFEDTKTGKQYQLRDNGINEYIPHTTESKTPEGGTDKMSDKQIAQVQAQLPEGAKILRMYKAAEGDIRVITKGKCDQYETHYAVKFIDDYPKIELM